MSKPKHPRSWPTPRRRRSCRNLRVSPRKLNLVAGLIRNQPAAQAVATLTFSKRRIAQQVKKALESAIANAENNHQLDVDRLVVSRAEVGRSVVMRRFHARGRGRSARVEKWFSHLKIVVAERAQERRAGGRIDGSQGQSDRAAARHQPHLGQPLVRRRRLFQAAARGPEAARPSAQEAARRRRVARGDRASGEEAARDDLCGAAGRGDRQEGPGHRGAEARARQDGEGRGVR